MAEKHRSRPPLDELEVFGEDQEQAQAPDDDVVEDLPEELEDPTVEDLLLLEEEAELESELETGEELELVDFGKVAEGDPLVDAYFRDVGRWPRLSHEKTNELINVYQAGLKRLGETAEDQLARDKAAEAFDQLYRSNNGLIVRIAAKYQGRGVPFLDLVQEGNIGFMSAIAKFDTSLGFKLSTYATWWIRQKIYRASREQGQNIRVPANMVGVLDQVRRARFRLARSLGRAPSLSELGAELEIPEENRVKELLTYIQVSDDMSLDSPVRASNGEVNDTELQDFIQDPSASTEDTAFQSLLFHAVNKILQTLPERDRQVLTLRKGLNGAQQHTLQEVGDQMNLTRQRVNQIERRATKRFMEHPDAKKLRGLL